MGSGDPVSKPGYDGVFSGAKIQLLVTAFGKYRCSVLSQALEKFTATDSPPYRRSSRERACGAEEILMNSFPFGAGQVPFVVLVLDKYQVTPSNWDFAKHDIALPAVTSLA